MYINNKKLKNCDIYHSLKTSLKSFNYSESIFNSEIYISDF